MKNYFGILFVVFLLSIFSSGCVKKEKPVVETNDFADITITSAKCNGNVISDGNADVSNRGICWSKDNDPSIDNDFISSGNGLGSFTCTLENLDPGTTYYYKAFATNSEGTSYGAEMSFKTLGEVPTIINNAATEIAISSARLSAGINSNHLATTVTFEYGTSTNYGSSAAAPESPVSGNTNVTVSANLSSLLPGTIYHYRVKAVNSLGTKYGEDMTFKTLPGVIDVDGNAYPIVQIGTQMWMAENLKTTKYNDNSSIPLVTTDATWAALPNAAYCWYNNDRDLYKDTYGALYNFYAVATGKLCPTGWHVPSNEDFTVLTTYLGDIDLAGGKLKEAGTTHWNSPNTGANNVTGFTALPAGQRLAATGAFSGIGQYEVWWTSTPYNNIKPWYRSVGYQTSMVFVGNGTLNQQGVSIRCIKD